MPDSKQPRRRRGTTLVAPLGILLASLLPAGFALPALATGDPGSVSEKGAGEGELRFLRSVPPLGLDPVVPGSGDDPGTAARLALGKSLFFDPVLSVDGTVSCGSCHRPDHGFSSPERFPRGVGGNRPARHAPTLFNRAWGKSFMWDGRFETLEDQVVEPIRNEREMGLPLDDALRRLEESDSYPKRFADAFPDGLSEDNLARALATFVRHIMIGDSPVDHFREGRVAALPLEAKTGLWIFVSMGRCWRCHSGPGFSDEGFHNTGVGARDGMAEPGRFAVTGNPEDRGSFKTPTLRGLVYTAPYMHDGSLASLEEVVDFYRRGGGENPDRSPLLEGIHLSDEEARSLVAFLRALSVEVEAGEAESPR